MKGRWIIAAAAAVGLGMAAVPFFSGDFGAAATSAAPKPNASCSVTPKNANLDFTLKDMNGKSVRLSDYKGKVIMLNFWATWCGPCKYEIPMFVDLQKRYPDTVAFLGVSIDDSAEQLQEFATSHKMNYPSLIGLGEDQLQRAYGPLLGVPVTVAITRDGTVCHRYMGLRSKDEFERDIKALL